MKHEKLLEQKVESFRFEKVLADSEYLVVYKAHDEETK